LSWEQALETAVVTSTWLNFDRAGSSGLIWDCERLWRNNNFIILDDMATWNWYRIILCAQALMVLASSITKGWKNL
jgi:hypothetical protein